MIPSTRPARSGQAPEGELRPEEEQSAFRRAVERAPSWMFSILLHLAVAALVLAPLVFWTRPVKREPPRFRVILADMSRGEDAPKDDEPGDGPQEAEEAVPEAPATGPEVTRDVPPPNPEPAPAPPAEDAPPAPSPDAVSEVLKDLRPRPAVAGDQGSPAEKPAAGGVPLGSPGSLGGLRSAAGRRSAVTRGGGSGDSEGAVEAGLRWLAGHQAPDGRWSGHDFHRHCTGRRCLGPGYITYDPGLTGLALSAFAGAGYTHERGPHQRTIRNGLEWLLSRQDERGYFFRRTELRDMYNHSCATLALAELYAVSGDRRLKGPLERAVQALVMAQQPGGGWTYVPLPPKGPRNDVSIAGFATQALIAARTAGVQVPETVLARVLGLLHRQTEPATGLVRYADGGANDMREGLGIQSVSILLRLLLGDDPSETGLKRGIHTLSISTPELEPVERPRSLNQGHYPVYYGTLAAYLAGGPAWARWNPAAADLLVRAQRTMGCPRGSWDPAGKWAASGGRIYATAISILTLQVYYKYPPSYLDGRLRRGSVTAVDPAPKPARPAEPDDEAAARARRLRELLGGGH